MISNLCPFIDNSIPFWDGELTTSRKSVVSHSRQQIPQGRDETECLPTGSREPNRKLAVLFLFKPQILCLSQNGKSVN
jgi:hypothetical protein